MSQEINRRTVLKLSAAGVSSLALPHLALAAEELAPQPFGKEHPELDSLTTGEWWTKGTAVGKRASTAPPMNVPRDQVVAFAIYTHDRGVLKMSAQLYPLKPGEPRLARLEVERDGKWEEIAQAEVLYPGWDAHFRVEKWDDSVNVPYRVRHGQEAQFTGLIRRDPKDQEEIVVANMSCNSSNTTGDRDEIVENLKFHNPDLLFFSGDQTYRHTEHTAGWIEFGLQFREVMRDRPTVCIPDDHDVGHGNLWGENGKQSHIPGDADGGYRLPVAYVNQVQRQQSSHLPDPVDPAPVERGIEVYFTRMTLGGIDFAIVEDRKFKSGPAGKLPKLGGRPDHIVDPKFDTKSIDLPNLQLLGPRQEHFLQTWTQDWAGAEMKCVLSQTAFCGAVHMHGGKETRLLADLDCNGWPQTPRRRALELIRQAWAVHLCGDQHLAVVVKHGVENFGDGPYGFTSPALVNTIYQRWWHPRDEKAGPNPVAGSPLPWTGEYLDGLGNMISMLAYANPKDNQNEKRRADGYGLVRFNKAKQTIVFECWPRFCSAKMGDKQQFPGWPITVSMEANDGRKVAGYLPEIVCEEGVRPVVQVLTEPAGEILYTVRAATHRFQPRVYAAGKYTVKVGRDQPTAETLPGLEPRPAAEAGERKVKLS